MNKYEKEVDHVTRLKAEKDQMNEELKNLRTLEIQRDRDREAERLSDKKATREADREKEEYRMKLVRFLANCDLLYADNLFKQLNSDRMSVLILIQTVDLNPNHLTI